VIPVDVLGIDLTSRPRPGKPITCARCTFDGARLTLVDLERWFSFTAFEQALETPGHWVAGMDFPFAQPRRLVENLGWPRRWVEYVTLVGGLERPAFKRLLDDYKSTRAPGDRHHKRACDRLAGSQSPQTTTRTPVGLMFFEGAPRLVRAGVHLPYLHDGDERRIVLECYPGVAARSLIGRQSYKSDSRSTQTPDRHAARLSLLAGLVNGRCRERYGFDLDAPMLLAEDPGADELDALICAIQAAWGWSRRRSRYGAPEGVDPLEGWICDPTLAPERFSP
jgi:hypothetical protein